MRIFALLELASILLLLYFIYSQILQPAIRGTKLFPFFRKEHNIQEEIEDVRQSIHEKELAEELHRLKEIFEPYHPASPVPPTEPTPPTTQEPKK